MKTAPTTHLIVMHGSEMDFVRSIPEEMSQREALELSAWIVTLLDTDGMFTHLLRVARMSHAQQESL